MGKADLKKVMAGFGLATLLAGVTLAGCASSQKSSCTGTKSGCSGCTGKQQQQQPQGGSSCTGTKK